jgi:hypothetical protein
LASLTKFSKQLEETFYTLEKHYKDMAGTQKKMKLQLIAENADSEPVVQNPDEGVIHFHKLADKYVELIKELQELARLKQSQVDPKAEKLGEDGSVESMVATHDVTPGGVGADVDLIAGLARPAWLDVLMMKYSKHMDVLGGKMATGALEPGGNNYPHCNPMNLGSFCAFLSCCLVGRIAVISQEHVALIEVSWKILLP